MSTKNEIDFDFDALEAELYSALAKAFTSLQLDFPDENFYNFTLSVSPSMVYVAIAANTEDGLNSTAKYFREKYPKYAEVSFDDVKALFRHEFGDFAYFAHGQDMSAYDAMLKRADEMLSNFVEETDVLLDNLLEELNDDFDAAWEFVGPYHDRILKVCERAMKRIDEDKVFELNSRRDTATLLVRHGDSEPDPEIARRLNPESVYTRFLKEYDHAQTVQKRIYSSQ